MALSDDNVDQYGEHDRTKPLFEEAWTTYSDDTYDHSVSLVEERLIDSGFDEDWFEGKTCFDGGCGTGRLSLAMARLGAEKVVAADFGGKSLDFFKRQLKRHGLNNVQVVEMDVTDLSLYAAGSFDFVASNGVLHHTPRCLDGLDEHYRITRPDGVLWLYLYGAGGFYWDIYDRMKKLVSDIEIAEIVRVMKDFRLREGFIYTFLDNVFAARTYYLESEIIERLSKAAPLEFVHQGGPAIFDNPGKYIQERFGKDIMGPQGEIRVVIHKKGAIGQKLAV
ncbi:MAG: class I SAM-dependent methyltransferase [Micavibrio aeruginosavorus]|uniref:Class I SAM-dependent methyltransferase n=1 Tax=Micavibrio aeruginosavorus TaxID=349221 RepID=A0A7T5R2L3_9BACT|nr:MAG: class I SAM-dependent methyltransferase [Micavibrio aeruginosavorus]